MKPGAVIAGAGGFAKEVRAIAQSQAIEIKGFVVGNQADIATSDEVIGLDDDIDEIVQRYGIDRAFVAVGDIAVRRSIVEGYTSRGLMLPNLVDMSSTNRGGKIGTGSIIYPGAVIMDGAVIGEFSLLNTNVSIGHDTKVGDFCNLNPGVTIAGNVNIGNSVFIGMGACVAENLVIGDGAVIGAGSVVLSDVESQSLVHGVPARVRNGR